VFAQCWCTAYTYKSPANTFNIDAYCLRDWVLRALRTNVTYFRLRRELFDAFGQLLDFPVVVGCEVEEEDYMVVRQFLSARSGNLSDDKRLSFDKSLTSLRAVAAQAISRHEAVSSRAGAAK